MTDASPAPAGADAAPRRWRTLARNVILAVAGALILARLWLALSPPPAPVEEVYRPLSALTPSPKPPLRASPPATTQVAPTLAAIVPAEPLRLAVAQDVHAQYASYFAALPRRYEGLAVIPYSNTTTIDAALAAQMADWVVYWAAQPFNEGILLREEPFVVAAHPLFPRENISPTALLALAGGREATLKMVVGDGGLAARELLGLDKLDGAPIAAAGWEAALDYVATHEGCWALLPWEAVDFRVRLLSVDGRAFNPKTPRDWPLLRRLWLSQDVVQVAALAEDLGVALHDETPQVVELVAVGDIMLDRAVKTQMQNATPRYPFEGAGVRALLSGADIAVGNLEGPISNRGTRIAKGYEFRADPSAVEGLTFAGFDVLTLANNHTGDYGDVALSDTLRYLSEAQIVSVGAGLNITAANEAKIVAANGVRMAFLAYNQIGPDSFAATATRPGVAWMDSKRMVAAVQAARQLADVVIVSCHWGTEYTINTTPSQREVAQALANAGAALVIGHHPHVVQGVRYEPRTFIAYSLGNFVFDMGNTGDRAEGLALRAWLGVGGVKSVELLPVQIKNEQPALLPKEGAAVLQRLWRVTKEQGGLPK